MTSRPSLAARAAAAVVTLAVSLTGLSVLTATPAEARLRETDFGFQSTAYGTRVTAEQIALRSSRTAFSYISCTRLTGIDRDVDQDDLGSVNGNEMIKVKAVDSSNRTYRVASKGIVGVQGTNSIGRVELGAEGQPKLVIRGLTTTAKAWHRGSRFHTSTVVDSLPIELTGVDPAAGGPLGDLLDQVDGGIQGVLDALRENAGEITIPQLGVLHLGYQRNTVRRSHASASTYVLKVDLFGADGVKGGGDDSQLALGRAWARITRNLPAGVFHGLGYAAQVDLLGGVAKVGRLATRPLPCEGTHGKVRRSSLTGLDLGAAGVLQLGKLTAYSYGVQRRDGSATGWTMGQVAGIALGSGEQKLVIDGIVGKAIVRQTRSGKVVRSTKGTTIGSLTVGGDEQSLPDPGQELTIPGLATVTTNVVDRTRRGISVTAVRIRLLDDSQGISVIKLGNATAKIRRH